MSVDAAFTTFYRCDDVLGVLDAYNTLEKAAGVGSNDLASRLKLLEQLKWCTLPGGADLSNLLTTKLEEGAGSPSSCASTKVLVIGGGPGGLRTAIEARVLGCNVELVEKRTYFSRSNVLKLWPGPVEDCLSLGLKVFYRKFGSRDSEKVSIKGLQIALLKVALLLGVKVTVGLTFRRIYPPQSGSKLWTVGFYVKGSTNDKVKLQCNVVVGADGENSRVAQVANIQSSVVQFSKALGITFNFQNLNSKAEVHAREMARTGFMYMSFFKEVFEKTGVQLENLIYLQEGTHYFVMAAKPSTLVSSGILLNAQSNLNDPSMLLDSSNVNQPKLLAFARQMTEIVGLPKDLPFSLDYHGRPDAGIFDFTKKRSCHASCKVLDSGGTRLLVTLVGDALVAPFWPLGTGANKAILGALDTAYAIRRFAPALNGSDQQLGQLLTDQLHVFQLMKSSNPQNLRKNIDRSGFGGTKKFLWTIDPETRYTGYRRSMMQSGTGKVTKVEIGTQSLGVDDALDAPNPPPFQSALVSPSTRSAPVPETASAKVSLPSRGTKSVPTEKDIELKAKVQTVFGKATRGLGGYGFKGTAAIVSNSGGYDKAGGKLKTGILSSMRRHSKGNGDKGNSRGAETGSNKPSWEETRKIKTITSYGDFSELGLVSNVVGRVHGESVSKSKKKSKNKKGSAKKPSSKKSTKTKRDSPPKPAPAQSTPPASPGLRRTPRFQRSVTTEAPASPRIVEETQSNSENLNVGQLRRMYSTLARESLRSSDKELGKSRSSSVNSRVKRLSKNFERDRSPSGENDDDLVDIMNGFGTQKFPRELVSTMSMMGFGDLGKLPATQEEDEDEEESDAGSQSGYTTLAVPVSIAEFLQRNPDVKTVDQLHRTLTREEEVKPASPKSKRNSGIFRGRW